MVAAGSVLAAFPTGAQTLDECTLWAATGNVVEGGGTLIAKNRDWLPDHQQRLSLFTPANGFAYFGLVALGTEAESRGLKAGINQYGLVVINASASAIPQKVRIAMPHTSRLMTRILSGCQNVDQALTHMEWFLGPEFLMLADKKKVAVIEIGPEGKTAVSLVENGTASHTNQFLDAALIANNSFGSQTRVRELPSSTSRLARIRDLVARKSFGLNLKDFVGWSLDQSDGPDNSIWRTGSTTQAERTLASWIVYLPSDGKPVLFVRLANPGHERQELMLSPADIFTAGKYTP